MFMDSMGRCGSSDDVEVFLSFSHIDTINMRRILLLLALAGASQGFSSFSTAPAGFGLSKRHCSLVTRQARSFSLRLAKGDDEEAGEGSEGNKDDNSIDVASDSRLYRLRLSRAPGIEWGTDLSFSFVYVREMDPTGDAAMSNQVQKGDQLCEVTPIKADSGERGQPINLVGAPFDFVMESFAMLDKTVKDVDLVFFRGTKDELKAAATGKDGATGDQEMITVMVYENKGTASEVIHRLKAPAGVNVRQLCVDNGINVYQSVTRWTNCKGKQLCGTCIVNVSDGAGNTNRKSMDEASTLRENPDSYRLSCVTFAYGDCTVETFPPINAAQWTR